MGNRGKVSDDARDNRYSPELTRRLSICVQALLFGYIIAIRVGVARSGFGYTVAGTAAACALVTAWFRRGERPAASIRLWFSAFLFAFLAANLLSHALAPDLPDASRTSLRTLNIPTVALAVAVALGVPDRRTARRLLIGVLILFGGWWVGQALRLPWQARAFSHGRLVMWGCPVVLGLEMALLSSLFFAYASFADRRWKMLAGAAAGVLTTGLLVMTGTRLAIAAWGVIIVPGVLLTAPWLRTTRRKLALLGIWFALTLPAAGLYLAVNPIRMDGAALEGRRDQLEIGARSIARAPWGRKLIGHGPSRRVFPAVATRYELLDDQGEPLGYRPPHAHNTLLQAAIETGAIGVITLVAAWFIALAGVARRFRAERGLGRAAMLPASLLIVLSATITMSLMDRGFQTNVPGQLSWLLLGLAVAVAATRPPREEIAA